MSALNEVVFLSQAWAEAYTPRSGEAIISITDRGAPGARLQDGWAAAFRIAFDDVDPVESPVEPEEDLVELQQEQADRIARFIVGIGPDVGTLVVHCRYGQSRSAGVAKAVAAAYKLPFPADYEFANNHVFGLVLSALRRLGVA